jgi:dipeptidyl aminopeptidase/acylaminoacyl peptidase
MRHLLVVLWLCPLLVHAQETKRAITLDDFATMSFVLDQAISPDGHYVAYSDSRWDSSDDVRKADLWIVPTNGKGQAKRLTSERANDRHLRWRADGKAIYALGNRKRASETKPPYDGTTQIWSIPIDGGEPQAITRIEGGVADFDYAPQANKLYYVVGDKATDDDPFSKLRNKYSKPEYGHGKREVSVIHQIDCATWRSEKIIGEDLFIQSFRVSPNGKRLAMITAPDDTVITSEGRSRVRVWDTDTNKILPTDEEWRKKSASPYPWLDGLAINEDGSKVAYVAIYDAYPAEIITNAWKENAWAGGVMKRPAGVQVMGYGSPLKWSRNELFYLAESNGKTMVVPQGLASKPESPFQLNADYPYVITSFDFSPDGNLRTEVASSGKEFAEIRTAKRNLVGPTTPLTNLNAHTRNWKYPTVKHITWKAPDGTEVGGVLELPPDYKPGDKLPLVVAMHGGPTTASKAELVYDAHNGRLYFAANGYAVLAPNYRGSTGYGDKFVTDLIGNENDIEVKDILAGIQHLIKEGIADPDRIGVMGWSNGGYLTNCLITLKDPPVKIKAASSGAGILDTVAEWGFNDEPAYPMVFKKGLPWETADIYRKTSPTYDLGNAKTPTLIHVGGNDVRCPPGHSRMLYRALKEYNKVPSELVVYPGEPHGLTKLSNRRAKMEWDLAWFDHYLKGK